MYLLVSSRNYLLTTSGRPLAGTSVLATRGRPDRSFISLIGDFLKKGFEKRSEICQNRARPGYPSSLPTFLGLRCERLNMHVYKFK